MRAGADWKKLCAVSVRVSSLECPRCHAPLTPSRFARQTECPYCGATVRVDPTARSAQGFREAFAAWDDPARHGFSEWLTLDGRHWVQEGLLARGAASDVYRVRRARWPTLWAVAKLLREPSQADRFAREGERLSALSEGALHLGVRAPRLLHRGEIASGAHQGRRALLYLDEPEFAHTLEDVRRALPHGVPPPVAVWIWRRLLELLSALHRSGLAHGAILPPHVLVQERDHGVRVVGFGCAGPPGAPLAAADPRFAAGEPGATVLSFERDLRMSAQVVAYALGGDFAKAKVSALVPAPLAALVAEVAHGRFGEDAWALRERVGDVGRQLFGPPSFHPLELPRET